MELSPRIFWASCFLVLAFLIQARSVVVETRETRTLGPLCLSAGATYAALTIAFAPALLPLGFAFTGILLFAARAWRTSRRRQAEAAEAAAAAAIAPQGGLDIR